MCYRDNDFVRGDFDRGRGNRRDRFVCECREVRGSRDNRYDRYDRYDSCDCYDCRRRRRRRNELVCRCWER